ncbi:MAG: M23 family metallopeptidase, partial [Chloroflexota bacterium]|nr:M23 family metallopeptidase [Chloroflexota bacterium]
GPQRGVIAIETAVHPAARATLVEVTLDGTPLDASPTASSERQRLEVDTNSLADGRHVLTLVAADRSRRRNRGAREVVFSTDNTAPQLRIETSVERVRAGVPLLVRWEADEPSSFQLRWGADPLPEFSSSAPAAGRPAGFSVVALPVDTGAGEVHVRVVGQDTAGNTAEKSIQVPVVAAVLPRQTLVVPGALAPLATSPVAREETGHVVSLTSAVSAERRWTGAFRSPLAGAPPRTTGFGDRRDYADGHIVHHAGYDLAAPAGAAVVASAGGVVTFSGPLLQRGNTVVLDHGWGIYTLYGHLQHWEVAVGQLVVTGQAIGRVGNTGLSTGPHLHWEVRLRGLAVDPDSWLALSAAL